MKCGDYQKKGQIYSKLRNINKFIMEFNDIFLNMKRKRQSRVKDETIVKKALSIYLHDKGAYQIYWILEYCEGVQKMKMYQNFEIIHGWF